MTKNPSPDSLTTTIRDAHANAVAKGWWEQQQNANGEIDFLRAVATIPEKLCLIHSEVSEALEEYRSIPAALGSDMRTKVSVRVDLRDSHDKPIGFTSELADIVIRVFDLAGALGIDLASAIRVKMEYNATRPHRHGGKRA